MIGSQLQLAPFLLRHLVPALAPLLVPVALYLLDEQRFLAVDCAVVEARVGEDVGFVPVTTAEHVLLLRWPSTPSGIELINLSLRFFSRAGVIEHLVGGLVDYPVPCGDRPLDHIFGGRRQRQQHLAVIRATGHDPLAEFGGRWASLSEVFLDAARCLIGATGHAGI